MDWTYGDMLAEPHDHLWKSADGRAVCVLDRAWVEVEVWNPRMRWEYSFWLDGECLWHDDDLTTYGGDRTEAARSLSGFLGAWRESENIGLFPMNMEPWADYVDEFTIDHIEEED